MHNRLLYSFAYMCGPMDHAPDGGIGWRDMMTPFLEDMGVIVLDPCKKPIDLGSELIEDRELRSRWKSQGRYDELGNSMKVVRNVDLRMVDKADFLVTYFDWDMRMCGTHEEISTANREKKPILIMFGQGKNEAPDWFFAKLRHELFFESWDGMKKYLTHVNTADKVDHLRRWFFFDLKDKIEDAVARNEFKNRSERF